MAQSKHVLDVCNIITNKRKFSPHPKKGAVMLKCVLQSEKFNMDKLLDGIEVYHNKNPAHFWMGASFRDPHITIHHGFELQNYEADGSGQDGFREDIEAILSALDEDYKLKHPEKKERFRDLIFKTELEGTAGYFPANPHTLQNGEDDYYTVIFRAQPTKELEEFRNALFKVLPHTNPFPTWSIHLSIATVPNETNRDKLMQRLNDNINILTKELMLGYNINK